MRTSLVVLATGAVLAGLLGLSASTGVLPKFLAPTLGPVSEPVRGLSEAVLSIISVAVALAGIALVFFVYDSGRFDWQALRARFAGAQVAPQRAPAQLPKRTCDHRITLPHKTQACIRAAPRATSARPIQAAA